MRRGEYSKNSEPVPCLSVSRRGRGGIEMNVGLVGRWWCFFFFSFFGRRASPKSGPIDYGQ